MIAFLQISHAQTYVPTEIERKCSEQADARNLHDLERKNFRARCKENGGQAAPGVVDLQPKKNIAKPPANVPPTQDAAEPKAAAESKAAAEPKAVARPPSAATAPKIAI